LSKVSSVLFQLEGVREGQSHQESRQTVMASLTGKGYSEMVSGNTAVLKPYLKQGVGIAMERRRRLIIAIITQTHACELYESTDLAVVDLHVLAGMRILRGEERR
jgi:hypothetical protein